MGRAKINITHDHLRSCLALPASTIITSVEPHADSDSFTLYVKGPDLPEAREGNWVRQVSIGEILHANERRGPRQI